jgi:tRNA A-37 threonylcarbamoyl transferase component Bud32
MNNTTSPARCPKCGGPIPAEALQGLCPKCALVAVATPTEAGQPVGDRPPPPALEAVTAAFPQLQILELIGAGGMGAVYKARQPRLDRLVALKLLIPPLATDGTFAERFNREARLLARLNHPGIVSVYDHGEAGGFFYLLMEFVDGVNLRQAMHAGRFTPTQALALVPKICDALQSAHEEGVLHRDIKPENLLLDTRGRVKIADFGIAKLMGDEARHATLTASGLAVGTPHYMAPEQLERPQDVDQRADIYSLGVVFYEMLTGELPIGRFAPPSQKTPVDPRVDEVVLRALERERERRQRHISEVKAEVEHITATPAVPALAPDQGLAQATSSKGTEPGSVAPGGTAVLAAGRPESARHAACYFSTPQRMRHCFPGPQAHIFQCKGELRLEAAELVFISPWQTRVVIPLKEIRDLSIGQFQMWTTPWVMKYERLNFLAVTFGAEAGPRTVHLMPVGAGATAPAQVSAQVAGWFDAIRQATATLTGAKPHTSEPAAVSVSAQSAWNRKGLPLFAAFVLSWLLVLWRRPGLSGGAPDALGLGLFAVMLLMVIGCGWFVWGFLRANRALKRGNFDAVTSDEPPDSAGAPVGPERAGPPRWSRASIAGAVLIGLSLPMPLVLGGAMWQGSREVSGAELWLMLGVVLLLGVPGTVLGWMGVGDLRAQRGRRRGAPLAYFAALAWPLTLVLGGGLFLAAGPGRLTAPASSVARLMPYPKQAAPPPANTFNGLVEVPPGHLLVLRARLWSNGVAVPASNLTAHVLASRDRPHRDLLAWRILPVGEPGNRGAGWNLTLGGGSNPVLYPPPQGAERPDWRVAQFPGVVEIVPGASRQVRMLHGSGRSADRSPATWEATLHLELDRPAEGLHNETSLVGPGEAPMVRVEVLAGGPARTVTVAALAPPRENFIVSASVLSNGVPVGGRILRAKLWPPSTRAATGYAIRWRVLAEDGPAPWEIVVEEQAGGRIAARLRPESLPPLEWSVVPRAGLAAPVKASHEARVLELARASQAIGGGPAGAADWSVRLQLQSQPPQPTESRCGIEADFVLPPNQAAVFEVVTRSNRAVVPVPGLAAYVVNGASQPTQGRFLWADDPDDLDSLTALPRWSFGLLGEGDRLLETGLGVPTPPSGYTGWLTLWTALKPDTEILEGLSNAESARPAYGLRVRTQTMQVRPGLRYNGRGFGTNWLKDAGASLAPQAR